MNEKTINVSSSNKSGTGIALRIFRRMGLTLLWGVALVLALLILVQFVLWSALFWINTSGGQKFIQSLIPNQMTAGEYRIEITGLSYLLPTRISLGKATLYSKGEQRLSLKDLRLVLDIKDISRNHLGITLNADIQDRPARINAQLEYQPDQNKLIARQIKVQAPDITMEGKGTYNHKDKSLNFESSGRLESLTKYPDLVGTAHQLEPVSFDIKIKKQPKQQITATYKASSAEYTYRELGIRAKNITVSGHYTQGRLVLDFMRAKDHEGGELQVSGFHQTKTGQTNLTLATEKLHIMSADILRGVLDARLDLTGEIKAGYSLTGEIKPEQLDVTIPESISGNIPQLNVAVKGDSEEQQKTTPPIAQNLELDIDFIAPRRIMVRGWGLDAEFGGNIQIKGSAAQPLFYGDLQARRGRYTEFGKVFKFTTANMNFAGSIPPSPTLDIETQTKAGDITAIITITGPVLSPKINFSSSPPLPEDEVMSHILFGEKMEDISPFQAVQLARTLNRFTGAGGQAGSALGNFDPIGSLRAATGLDELRIETSEEGGASIGAGKYLTDKVYLEFESGTEEGAGSANVQVELTPNITIESEVGQDSGGGAGIFWKWDY